MRPPQCAVSGGPDYPSSIDVDLEGAKHGAFPCLGCGETVDLFEAMAATIIGEYGRCGLAQFDRQTRHVIHSCDRGHIWFWRRGEEEA